MFSVSDNYPFYYTLYVVLASERQRDGDDLKINISAERYDQRIIQVGALDCHKRTYL